ncbi:MAG: TRAP transporter large permease subunit [Bryobacterales bacterium]
MSRRSCWRSLRRSPGRPASPILSMGALLLPALTNGGYPGAPRSKLVTVSGSIGLLFPPSLPVILYAFYADQPLEKLFVGGLLPGFLLVTVVAGYAAMVGARRGVETTPFSMDEAKGRWRAKWDLFLPVLVLGGIFGGFTTLVEAAALTVLYAFVIECGVFRSLSVTKDLPRIFLECATLVGGFMIILGVALGLTNWLIFEQIPDQALAWVRSTSSRSTFSCLRSTCSSSWSSALMDIYSAIIVVVPLITPIRRPTASTRASRNHLPGQHGLGYLMPPMGENLFLSAFRFDKSLIEVYRATLPYMLILLAAVLVITYWPAFTLGPASLVGP